MLSRLALALACLLPVAAAQAFTPEELFQTMAGVGARRVGFVEERHVSYLDSPAVSEGIMAFRPPARLEKQVRQPIEERIVIDGEAVTIESAAIGSRRLDLAEAPLLAALAAGLRGVLGGDLAAVRQQYFLELSGAAAGWTLVLLPRGAAVQAAVKSVRLDGVGAQVIRLELTEPDGDRIVTRLAPAS